jgi:uncharacterized protein with LGFP repeats
MSAPTTERVPMTERAPMTERLVGKLASGLFGRKPGRRGFLAGAAVVGSALAVDPWGYMTRPASAYDAVCGSGAACADGWSAFCCSVNSGKNSCPPGSFVGGWWKADRSGFCAGSARYYVDCNASCGSSWRCHCNTGSCDERRVACNQFRYGQCNQQISCYGPVVCRVVTCTPPWQYDHSCTSASATDNNTASHSAPCLSTPASGTTPIGQLYAQLGGAGSFLGAPTAAERRDSKGGRYAFYQHGAIFTHAGTGPHEVHDKIWVTYRSLNAAAGPLGYPTSNQTAVSDGIGQYNHFQHGAIFWSPASGSHAVVDPFYGVWMKGGSSRGRLGYPRSNVIVAADHRGRYTLFQHGAIYWSPHTGAHALWGPTYEHWRLSGGGHSRLGYPTGGTHITGNTQRSDFEHGALIYNQSTHKIVQL